jgi:glucosamine-6-phosphate deaminase
MGGALQALYQTSWHAFSKRGTMRKLSCVAPDWWDYTTLDSEIVRDAARLTPSDLEQLSRPGFSVVMYDTIEEFYLAEALEYIQAWKQSSPDRPAGICGPIGPTEQLPLVARLVNAMELNLGSLDAHFWGMDEWVLDGQAVGLDHPLSFAKADKQLCFDRIDPRLQIPEANLHFPTGDLQKYSESFDQVACLLMQGGQGDVKHWAFNDPLKREGSHADEPPSPAEYRKLATRIVDLHPMTVMQNARTSGGGNVSLVPTQAATVGPVETWKSAKVSIWQAGCHDNPFGMRLTTLMISKQLPDSAVPMSLLADHPNVQFNFFRPGLGTCEVEMH